MIAARVVVKPSPNMPMKKPRMPPPFSTNNMAAPHARSPMRQPQNSGSMRRDRVAGADCGSWDRDFEATSDVKTNAITTKEKKHTNRPALPVLSVPEMIDDFRSTIPSAEIPVTRSQTPSPKKQNPPTKATNRSQSF